MKLIGKFGRVVNQYEKARRPFPVEVFRFLKSLLNEKKPLILDLGCGTGISTRQLVRIGTVIGVDPDARMLGAAKKHKNSGAKIYIKAYAKKLPFKNEIFDIVTAFSAFHWFTDKKSIKEIKRVLKPGGLLVVVNKTGIIDWGREYRDLIIKVIKQQLPQFRTHLYNPKKILKNNGFKSVKYKQWWKSELYSLPRVIQYVQSVSLWNSVPESKKPEVLLAVKDYYKDVLKRYGKIERRLKVSVVVGTK